MFFRYSFCWEVSRKALGNSFLYRFSKKIRENRRIWRNSRFVPFLDNVHQTENIVESYGQLGMVNIPSEVKIVRQLLNNLGIKAKLIFIFG